MKQIVDLVSWLGAASFSGAPKFLEIEDDPIPDGEGTFGKIYDLLSYNGQQPTLDLVVKVLPGSANRGFETTQTLQRRCLACNQQRRAARMLPLEDVPGLIALPRFSCRGRMGHDAVVVVGMLRLDSYGYQSFYQISERDDLFAEYQTKLSTHKRIELAFYLVEAFRLLKAQDYIHADLNPKNIFVHLDVPSLAVIDFDSGAVTDRSGQNPTTEGKKSDGEWQGFEIIRQSNRRGGTSISVNLHTDMWSVVVGIHFLLFVRTPLMFLSEISENSLRAYFAKFRWPDCDRSFKYFNRQVEADYQQYIQAIKAKAVAPLIKHFEHSINEGLLHPERRVSYGQWEQHLRSCLPYAPNNTVSLSRKVKARSTQTHSVRPIHALPPTTSRSRTSPAAKPPSIRPTQKSSLVSPPASRRPLFTPGAWLGLACLGVIAVSLVFGVIGLLVQSRQPVRKFDPNPRVNSSQLEQVQAIKTPRPGESVEFDITASPNSWSPLITIPRDYHLAVEIIGNQGAKVWRSIDGNINNYEAITKASGSDWNVWSNSFVKIYNPLGKRMPYMAGPWASSVQFKSAERFPITVRIRLEPARQESTLDQKQRSALTPAPSAQSSPPTRRGQGIFGIISSIDFNRQTFTVISIGGTNVFNVTNKTKILRSGHPVTLRDLVENEKATGAAVRNNDGSLDAIMLELGETAKASSDPNRDDIQTFNLQAVAYRDAFQTMRQEWPRETFGYFDTKMSYGDLTGDHRDEAAVWARYRLSGEASTPSLSHVFVYTLKGGRVVLIATLKGGDRAYGGIESVKIQDSHLVLGRYKPETPSACMACYGFIETTDYRWDGNGLATTGVRVLKIERKSQNTSVQPNQDQPQETALAQISPTIAPSSPPSLPLVTFPGERFSETRNRILTAAELQTWSTDQVQYAINEIFARHGGDFPDKKSRATFERFAWYHPQPGVSLDRIEASLPYIEQQNVKILGEVRNTKRNPLSVAAGAWYGIFYWKDGTANKQELIFTSDLSQVQNRASTIDASSSWNNYPVQKKAKTLNWQIPGPGRTIYLTLAPDLTGQQAQASSQIVQQGRVTYSATGTFYRYDVPLPAPQVSGPDPRTEQIVGGLLHAFSQAIQKSATSQPTSSNRTRSSNYRPRPVPIQRQPSRSRGSKPVRTQPN